MKLFLTSLLFLGACSINSQKLKIDSPVMRGLIRAESGWNPDIVSSKGAIGLAQILPATAKAECGLSRKELFNPEKNIKCGEKYLAKAITMNNGKLNCATINLYNTGIYATPRCSSYARAVLAYAELERKEPFSTVPTRFKYLVH